MMSIWFLSSYFGAMVGLALLSETGTVLEELDRGHQLCLGALLIFGLGLFHGIAAVISMRTLAPLGGLTWSGALLCSGHWAVLGVFVLRTGWPLVAKCVALTCLGWWIPALLSDAPTWARLWWALAPERHLEAHSQSSETSLGLLVDTMPLVAWWVASALLPTRSAFKR